MNPSESVDILGERLGDTYKRHALGVLARGTWFKSLPAELQTLILDNSYLRTVNAGQVISPEDQRQTGFFGVLEGQVAITRRVSDTSEFFYHLGGPGFWFGEAGLINRSVALVTAAARTEVRYLVLPAARFEGIVERNPANLRCFVDLQAARYSLLLRHLAQRSGLKPEEYLPIRLAEISDLIQSDGTEDKTVTLALSQTDVANMIGASRQTVNVLLKKLEAQGLIKLAFRQVKILDPKALRKGKGDGQIKQGA